MKILQFSPKAGLVDVRPILSEALRAELQRGSMLLPRQEAGGTVWVPQIMGVRSRGCG